MVDVSRRHILVGGAAIAGVTALMKKPSDESGQRSAYFLEMQSALITAGITTPTLVIDRARLNANIDTLVSDLPDGMGYRVVAKSLPSLALIDHIRQRAKTNRLMTFNLPMLLALSEAMPDASQLLGKPMPVRAAAQYFEQLPDASGDARAQVQWLVDTPERLSQYAALAEGLSEPLAINLELDVGLHRGGFVPGNELGAALGAIQKHPNLSLAGFMGYEPHIPSLPTTLGWRDKALEGAWNKYRAVLKQAQTIFGADATDSLTRNAAGSPTYRYYKDTQIANEISAGSCLVKPTHFDTDLLEPHQPACFIATPIIKAMDQTQMPGLEFADATKRAWDPNSRKTIFIYGGHWLADPIDPPGLSYNSMFGRSSNQEMLNGGPSLDVAPDDFVFFRPHQSEAVFLQFGDIAVYQDGAIVDTWPVFPASA